MASTESHVTRKLAAILQADVVGYSRLMDQDEIDVLTRLDAHRTELIVPTIESHHGHIVKFIGDGILAEFPSVVEAVACAVEIQQGMADRNQNTPQSERIEWRIGINLGDVLVTDDDIYGHGVNVTARLEALADPGGICLSDIVYKSVRGKLDLEFVDLGDQQVKNIAEPVRVYRAQPRTGPPSASTVDKHVARERSRSPQRTRLIASAAVLVVLSAVATIVWFNPWEKREQPATLERMAFSLPDEPSLAVLPFNNMSGDPEQEYFADGLTENIITTLSQIPELFVIARNSVFTYKGRPVRVQQVAEELGVRYVLEGSYQRSGDMIRIHAQFIDALTGRHLWAERFDVTLTDFFQLQDFVTQNIVSALKVRITEAEKKRLAKQFTDSYDAYNYFLRGQSLYSRYMAADNQEARSMFQAAIDLDDDFSRAYGYLALTYMEDYRSRWTTDPESSFRQAVNFSEKALSIDQDSPYTHWVRSIVYLNVEHRLDDAQAHAKTAISLDPNGVDSYALLATIKTYTGEFDEAVTLINKAMRLSPHSPSRYLGVLGRAYYFQGKYELAAATLLDAIERNAAYLLSHVYLAATYSQMGKLDEAAWEASEIQALVPNFVVAKWLETQPIQDVARIEQLTSDLRKAGLP